MLSSKNAAIFLSDLIRITSYNVCYTKLLRVWQSAGSRRKLRIVASLLISLGVLALTVGLFVPMQPRGTEQGLTGALHLIEGAVAMLMVLATMVFASTVFANRFRLYTFATIVVMLVFGAWSGIDAPS